MDWLAVARRPRCVPVVQPTTRSAVLSGAVEQGACQCARCGCLDAAGLTTCPRRLSLGRFVLAPLRESSSLVRHPIRGCARVRVAALNAPPLYPLRSCGASAAVARLSCGACSAIGRSGVQGGEDFKHLSGRDGARTRGASPWAYSHLHIGGPSIYPAWGLRPEYLPSSASCSGVRGGAAFVPRSIALSRVGSVCMRIIL